MRSVISRIGLERHNRNTASLCGSKFSTTPIGGEGDEETMIGLDKPLSRRLRIRRGEAMTGRFRRA